MKTILTLLTMSLIILLACVKQEKVLRKLMGDEEKDNEIIKTRKSKDAKSLAGDLQHFRVRNTDKPKDS